MQLKIFTMSEDAAGGVSKLQTKSEFLGIFNPSLRNFFLKLKTMTDLQMILDQVSHIFLEDPKREGVQGSHNKCSNSIK